jgi:hypothetical protein
MRLSLLPKFFACVRFFRQSVESPRHTQLRRSFGGRRSQYPVRTEGGEALQEGGVTKKGEERVDWLYASSA